MEINIKLGNLSIEEVNDPEAKMSLLEIKEMVHSRLAPIEEHIRKEKGIINITFKKIGGDAVINTYKLTNETTKMVKARL